MGWENLQEDLAELFDQNVVDIYEPGRRLIRRTQKEPKNRKPTTGERLAQYRAWYDKRSAATPPEPTLTKVEYMRAKRANPLFREVERRRDAARKAAKRKADPTSQERDRAYMREYMRAKRARLKAEKLTRSSADQ